MTWKNLAQASISDALVKHREALEELDGIHQLIDRLEADRATDVRHSCQKTGQGGMATLLMFKFLLLQS
jgi:hypothetical protein